MTQPLPPEPPPPGPSPMIPMKPEQPAWPESPLPWSEPGSSPAIDEPSRDMPHPGLPIEPPALPQ